MRSPSTRRTVGGEPISSEVTDRPITLSQVAQRLEDSGSGAVVLFVGRVRPEVQAGRRLTGLDYEADRRMALARLSDLERQARRRFGTRRIHVVHRIGRLRVGTASVIIGVAAAHRSMAFEAARFLIEELKREVPIWKTDRWARGPTGRRRRTRRRPRGARSPG